MPSEWGAIASASPFLATQLLLAPLKIANCANRSKLLEHLVSNLKNVYLMKIKWLVPSLLALAIMATDGLSATAFKSPRTKTPRSKALPKSPGLTLVLQGDKFYQFGNVATSRGGKWLASSQGESGAIQLWAGKSALQWGNWPESSGEVPLRFTPDTTRLLTRVYRGDIERSRRPVALVSVPTGKLLRTFNLPPFPLWCDNVLVRGIKDRQILTFDLKTGRKIATRDIESPPEGERRSKPRFAFSRNGRFLIEGRCGTIRWWRTSDGKLLGQINDPLRSLLSTAISDDGKWLASEGDDPNWKPPEEASSEAAYARNLNLHVWNASNQKLIGTFPGYPSLSGGAHLLEFSSDGRTLFGACDDGLDRFNWQSGKNSPLPGTRKDGPKGFISTDLVGSSSLSDDGRFLGGVGRIAEANDYVSRIQLWNMSLSKLVANFAGALRAPSRLIWSPDGKYLAGGDELTLWDARTGALLAENSGVYANRLRWIDNQTLCTQTLGKSEWFRAPKLEKLREFDVSPPAPPGDPYANQYSGGISVSPDEKWALTGDPAQIGSGRDLWVWDVPTKKLLRKISASFGSPTVRASFSPPHKG
jgi:WD40 repeat protein